MGDEALFSGLRL